MFLAFSLVLLFVVIGILASVYSIFFPFMQNLWSASDYHTAYYGAVTALERAELVLKYKGPWFEWSWWFLWDSAYGPASDYTPALLPGLQEWLGWNISSRTTTIPMSGMGNVDPMLVTWDSRDYNQLGYVNIERFLLYYDQTDTPSAYYDSWDSSFAFFSGNSITWTIRLPQRAFTAFWRDSNAKLCDESSPCPSSEEQENDTVAVAWSLVGLHNGNDFTILPTSDIFYVAQQKEVNYPKDTMIRDSLINATGNIAFLNSFTPIANDGDYWNALTWHTVISSDEWEIIDKNFQNIFASTDFSGLRLSFNAATLFRAFNGSVYPYLEYQFTFPQPISDRFYTIQWKGRVGDYDVNITVKKPTVEGTIGSDLTISL